MVVLLCRRKPPRRDEAEVLMRCLASIRGSFLSIDLVTLDDVTLVDFTIHPVPTRLPKPKG